MMSVDAFASYGASSSGMLAFRRGSSLTRIVWADRDDGEMTEAWPRPGRFNSVQVSRDDRYIVSEVATNSNSFEVWLLDIGAGTPQLLSNGTDDARPVFSPDDSAVAYTSVTDDGYAILSVSVEGSREPEELLRRNAFIVPTGWSADGRYIAYYAEAPVGNVWLLPTDGSEPIPITDSAAAEK